MSLILAAGQVAFSKPGSVPLIPFKLTATGAPRGVVGYPVYQAPTAAGVCLLGLLRGCCGAAGGPSPWGPGVVRVLTLQEQLRAVARRPRCTQTSSARGGDRGGTRDLSGPFGPRARVGVTLWVERRKRGDDLRRGEGCARLLSPLHRIIFLSTPAPDPRELVPGPATRPRRRDSGRHGPWGLKPPSTEALGGPREGAQLGPRQGCGGGVRWEPAPRGKPRSPRSAPLNPGWGSPPPGPVSAARASRLIFRAPEGRRPRHVPKPLASSRRGPAPAYGLKSSAPRGGRVFLDHPGLARASAAGRPPRIARGRSVGLWRSWPRARQPGTRCAHRNREFSMIGVDGKAANCYMLPDGSRVGPPSLLPPLLLHTLPRSPPALPTGGT
nr:uncharacterized protein LOC129012375 [Pongo pygmaeus]